MKETVYSMFDDGSTPITGLVPSIVGVNGADGSALFSGQMEEVGAGRYKYEISNYDKGKTYLITVDGGPSVTGGGRVQPAINTLDSYQNKSDWRNVTVIDPEEIAKVIWSMKPGDKEIDFGPLVDSMSEIKTIVSSITIPDISDIKTGASMDDILEIVDRLDNGKQIENIVSMVKPIADATKTIIDAVGSLKEQYNDIYTHVSDKSSFETTLEKVEEVLEKAEDVYNSVSDFSTVVEKTAELPNIVDNYKRILDAMSSTKSVDEKFVAIRLGISDILAKLKK